MTAKQIKTKIDLSKIDWGEIYQSDHFIFFVTKGSVFKKSDAFKCEKHFLKICRVFGFPANWKKKIKIYIAPNQNVIQKVVGRRTFGAVIDKLSLISVYGFHPHEITHIIFNNNFPINTHNVFKEGVAVLYGWSHKTPLWQGKSLSFWLKKFKKDKKIIPSFKKLFCNFHLLDSKISYPLSGAFVGFLIERYGIKNFKKLYTTIKSGMSYKMIRKKFKVIIKKDLKELENQFWRRF